MTNEIPKKLEGNPIELGKEELETVAGGLVASIRTKYVAVCVTCGWNATFATRLEANDAGAVHLQNNPDHILRILGTTDNAAPGA